MFSIVFSKQFLRHVKSMPRSVQMKADSQLGFLAKDFRDSRLHTKKLKGNNPYFAFRVGRDYRVLFLFQDDGSILILDIKHRKDVYKRL